MENGRLPDALERPSHTFSSRAVDVLRTMVLEGRLASGERLNEVELAGALGISRGPLREAIQRLQAEGLLTAVSGRGAFVRTFTPAALGDLYEVRIALESHAVRLAAARAGRADLADLRAMLDATGEALDGGRSYPQTPDFHARLVALAGNAALSERATEVNRQVSLARSRSGGVAERAHEALDEHRAVLEQVERGDADAAAALLADHLHASLRSALAVLQRDARTA